MTVEVIEKNDIGIDSFDLKSTVSQIFIPFSDISSQTPEVYIYSGGEQIPFRERHPIFQALMLDEFENC